MQENDAWADVVSPVGEGPARRLRFQAVREPAQGGKHSLQVHPVRGESIYGGLYNLDSIAIPLSCFACLTEPA